MKVLGEVLLWGVILSIYIVLSFVFIFVLASLFKETINNPLAHRVFTAQLASVLSLVCVYIACRHLMKLPMLPGWCISRNVRHYGMAALGTFIIFLIYFAGSTFINIREAWVADLISGNNLTLLLVLVTILILAPISEEVIMRWWGIFILGRFRLSAFFAVIVTSTVFAAMHSQQYSQFSVAYIFILGCWFGFLRVKTNSISVPIVAHMLAGLLGSLTVLVN
jgi:membrane protease YdiL (CAAX protease family)